MNTHYYFILIITISLFTNPSRAQTVAKNNTQQFLTPPELVFDNTGSSSITDINNIVFYKDDMYSPSLSATEIIEQRTRNSKYYQDKNNPSKYWIIYSSGELNYLKNSRWETIDERLYFKEKNIYEAYKQEEPVGFDISNRIAYIKSLQGEVSCNQWTLHGVKNGDSILLAYADWSRCNIGKQSVTMTNIFPDIDAQMIVNRGSIETNFIIKKDNWSHFDCIIFRDNFSAGLDSTIKIVKDSSQFLTILISDRSSLILSPAIAFQEKFISKYVSVLPYTISNKSISFSLSTHYISSQLKNGNIIIDPMIYTVNSIGQLGITGSMDCGSKTNSCEYFLDVPTPSASTITGVYFKFGFQTVGPALNKNGFWTITSDTCQLFCRADPNDYFAYNSPGSTSTKGVFADISSKFLKCMPQPSCKPQNVRFTLGFYNDICSGSTSCSNNYIKANQPFTIMIEGYSLETDSINTITICKNETVNLIANPRYGVPPYSYIWNTGDTTPGINVQPLTTTTFEVSITDQCNTLVHNKTKVIVRNEPMPSKPIAGSNSPVCEGDTIKLTTTTIPGVNYNWTGPNNFASNNQNPVIYNSKINNAGTYIVTASTDSCMSLPDTVNVVIPTSTIFVSINANSKKICEGAELTFTATPINGGSNPEYLWYVNGASTGITGNIFTSKTLKDNDVVYCTLINNDGGCVSNTPVMSNSITVNAVSGGSFAIDIDGNIYKTIPYGNQLWFAENLKTTKYNNGNPIPNIINNTDWVNCTTDAYCEYNNDISNIKTHGRLYNWKAVKTGKLCPYGWHVPSNDEWETLQSYLISKGYNFDGSLTGNKIGKSVASKSGWHSSSLVGGIGNNLYLNNSSSFNGSPNGKRNGVFGTFQSMDYEANWWTSTEFDNNYSYNSYMEYSYSWFYNNYNHKQNGFAIRCVRDVSIVSYLSIILNADKTEICPGDSANLHVQICYGTAPYTYMWNNDSTIGDSVLTVSPLVDSEYTVTVTDADGNMDSDTVFIKVKQSSLTNINDTACDNYTFNNIVYTSSGIYTHRFTNKDGCDSIIILNLTINSSSKNEISRTVCNSYTLNGMTYNFSGTYYQYLTDKNACDSVIVLHLTVNNHSTTTSDIYKNVCDSYILNGYYYDSTGIYTQTLKNMSGCDSIINLHLTVNKPKDSTINVSICEGDSFSLNGNSYSTTGIYSIKLINSTGCDSLVILNLIVNAPTDSTINVGICEGDSYSFNGNSYSTTGSYSVNLVNSTGCDSSIVLNLIVNKPTDTTINISICEGERYLFNGNSYSTTGIYTTNLTNFTGCDSTVILCLNVIVIDTTFIDVQICLGDNYIHDGIGYSKAGDYYKTYNGKAGCDSVVKIHLTENGILPDIIGENKYCEGDTHQSFYLNNTITFDDIKWYVNDAVQESNNQKKTAFFDLSESGKYIIKTKVEVSNCSTEDSITVLVSKHTMPSFTYLDNEDLSITLINTTIEQVAHLYEYNWTYDDKTYATDNQEMITCDFQSGGNFIVSLKVEDNFGCIDSISKNIHLDLFSSLYIPSALSPNNPVIGVSEFKPVGLYLRKFEIWIFDKWGNIIWYSNRLTKNGSPAEGWAGEADGILIQSGCYIWKINVTYKNGTRKIKYGTVTLIR